MSAAPLPHRPHLDFEARTHTYRLDGEIVPSVTQVLKDSHIIDYSMIPQEILQAAAARGTAVHQALHYWADDRLDDSSVDPSIAGYVAAGIRFHEESRLVIIRVECRVFDAIYRYAGTFDLECLINDELWIIDYKTGIILPGHALQVAGYTNCMKSPRRYRRAALKLYADGNYKIYEFAREDLQRDTGVFLSAVACAQYRLQHRTRGGI